MDEINDKSLVINNSVENLYNNINDTPVIKFLTQYEKTKVIQQRATEIANNAQLYVGIYNEDNLTAIEKAEIELYSYKIPYIISRKMPYDKIEYVKLNKLNILEPISTKLLPYLTIS